jgi:hypothetical protein
VKKSLAYRTGKEYVPAPLYVSSKFSKVEEHIRFDGCVGDLNTLRERALNSKKEEQYYIWTGQPDLKEQVKELYKSDVVPTYIQMNPYNWVIGFTFPLGEMKVHVRVVSDEVASEEVLRLQYQVEHETKKIFCDTHTQKRLPFQVLKGTETHAHNLSRRTTQRPLSTNGAHARRGT